MKNTYILLIMILLVGIMVISGCSTTPGDAQVKNGNTVEVNYTGKLTDGTIFDTSAGREPLKFTLGKGEIIPGFEKAVMGMKAGEKKTVTIPATEAYGSYREDLTMEVPRTDLPSNIVPEVGMQLESNQTDGSRFVVTITKVSTATVTIDANHPLAGKDLTFEIELVKIL
jgi:peptidylprolyl isomerase